MMRLLSHPSRRPRYILRCARAHATNWYARKFDCEARRFFCALNKSGYDPNAHIDVLPHLGLIYIAVPKCATTTIKGALAAMDGGAPPPPDKLHMRRHSRLFSPARVGISAFHRLALSPNAFRFSFVRNPYARLVSAWADKYRSRPLVPGNRFIDVYLKHRAAIDHTLPHGPGQTLTFAQFATFAAATANRRLDPHWQLQDDIVSMPGVKLDHIGKVEAFCDDIVPVLDHADASQTTRAWVRIHQNTTNHLPWPDYYDADLAATVYRAYERDFDRFGYVRAIKR